MQYEIEIKTLLGDEDNKNKLVDTIVNKGAVVSGGSQQLNHYFTGTVNDELVDVFSPLIEEQEQKDLLGRVVTEGQKHSIRTRKANDDVIFVIKASIDDTTSENGIARIEFEYTLPMTLDALDQLLLDCGFEYQAKWSRDRVEYTLDDTTICIDRNAGYGYLAEFEQVVTDAESKDTVEADLRTLMGECGVSELPQDRLARMFEHYNTNWPDYYGTDKIFVVE